MEPIANVLLVDLGSHRTEVNEPIGIGALVTYITEHLKQPVAFRQKFVQLDGLPSPSDLAWANIVGLATRLGSLDRITAIHSNLGQIPTQKRPLLVLGDLIATYATEELLNAFPESLCVVGEGEEALLGLLTLYMRGITQQDALRDALAKEGVPNLAFLAGGRVVRTARALMDLGHAPAPDRHFTRRVAAVGGVLRAEASRGCGWGKCSFCAIQHKYCNIARWRPVPIARIVGELCELSSMGVRSPFYTDEDFVGDDPSRIRSLASELRRARQDGGIAGDLTMYLNARNDTVLASGKDGVPSGQDIFAMLKAVGLREVFLGIESGSKEQVKRYRKTATANRSLAAMKVLTGLGITLDIGFIMFDPEMTLAELKANLDFIDEAGLKTHDARLTKSLRVIPGTPMVETYREKDLICGPLDVNNLVYPYRWANGDVENVYSAFAKWEEENMDFIYDLQAKTRGEVRSESVRRDRRRLLGTLRSLDLDVLRALVTSALDLKDPQTVDLSKYRAHRESATERGRKNPACALE